MTLTYSEGIEFEQDRILDLIGKLKVNMDCDCLDGDCLNHQIVHVDILVEAINENRQRKK